MIECRKYFSKLHYQRCMRRRVRKLRSNELEEVKGGGYFAATTDLWSSTTSEPYISYTVHFIKHNWELRSRCLQAMFMLE